VNNTPGKKLGQPGEKSIMENTRKDLYSEITNQIIADLEKGIRPWMRPWDDGGGPGLPLRSNGEAYRGINVLLLWSACNRRGYSNPTWLTYRQAQELKGSVRKGEKSTSIVYSGTVSRLERTEQGEEKETEVPFLKAYSVFNVEQTDGLPEEYYAANETGALPAKDRDERVERFFAKTGAIIQHGGRRAFYDPHSDQIQMPSIELFREPVGYYSTLAHELTHWTDHPDRSLRKKRRRPYASPSYAREELVAELGAAFLCADLQLSLQPRKDHADYIGGWLEFLRNDKRAIFQAAANAQRAVDFLHSLQ
jgi:antirestriction protein ArdC